MPYQPRILLIEAEPSLRHTLAAILRQAGFAVTTACHTLDALVSADGRAYDLIFVDIDRAEPANVDLVQTLYHVNPDVPVLIFAGSPAIGRMSAASPMERRAYLVKPIDPAKMLACIRDLLARSYPPVI